MIQPGSGLKNNVKNVKMLLIRVAISVFNDIPDNAESAIKKQKYSENHPDFPGKVSEPFSIKQVKPQNKEQEGNGDADDLGKLCHSGFQRRTCQ